MRFHRAFLAFFLVATGTDAHDKPADYHSGALMFIPVLLK
jgi:hypothetical protein